MHDYGGCHAPTRSLAQGSNASFPWLSWAACSRSASYDKLEVEQPLHFIKDSITGRMLQDFAQQWLERSDLQNMWRELSTVGSSGWSGDNGLVVDVAWGAEDGYCWDRNIYRLRSWTMHNTSRLEEDLRAMQKLNQDFLQYHVYMSEGTKA